MQFTHDMNFTLVSSCSTSGKMFIKLPTFWPNTLISQSCGLIKLKGQTYDILMARFWVRMDKASPEWEPLWVLKNYNFGNISTDIHEFLQ